jgi:hypothetical protein
MQSAVGKELPVYLVIEPVPNAACVRVVPGGTTAGPLVYLSVEREYITASEASIRASRWPRDGGVRCGHSKC